MAHYILVSDKPLEGHEEFLTGAMEELRKHRVLGLTMVAFLAPEENGERVLTGYYNLRPVELQKAALYIQEEATSEFIKENVRRYMEEIERERGEGEK